MFIEIDIFIRENTFSKPVKTFIYCNLLRVIAAPWVNVYKVPLFYFFNQIMMRMLSMCAHSTC